MNTNCLISRLITNCELIQEFCLKKPSETNDQFATDCERLRELAQFINRISAEFFLEAVHENGFRIFVRLSSIYTDKIAEQIKVKRKIHPHYMRLLKLVLNYGDWMVEMYGELKDEQKNTVSSSGQLFVKTKPGFTNWRVYERVNLWNDDLPLKFSTCFCYWLPDDVRRGLRVIYLSIATGKDLPWSLSSLFSSKYYDKYILSAYTNVNLRYPFTIWHLSENPLIVNTVNFLVNFGLPVKSKTVHLHKQTRFRLGYQGNILDFDTMTKEEIDAYSNDEAEQERQRSPGLRHRNQETIRCRYSFIENREKILKSQEKIRKNKKINPKKLKYHTVRRPREDGDVNNNCLNGSEGFDPNPGRKLVLYIHGGAFFTMGAKSYELFLRKLVKQLGGCNILAIDYSLTVPYPIPLQEILDVYLWLVSGREEVKQMLGFHPTEIILAGDSAGGYFSLTLTIAVNEINKMLAKTSGMNGLASKNPAIRLPSAIFSAFGLLSFSHLGPSMALPTLEPMVETHLILVVISLLAANVWCHGDFKRIESSERYQRIAEKNKGKYEAENTKLDSPNDDRTPWFRCDYATYMNRSEYIASFFQHPLINPLLYEHKLDELKSVDLYCCVGNDDFALDSSIEMARTWKGKVCLTVFEDVTHAYLQLTPVSVEASEAFAITTRRLQEAVGLCQADCSV